MAGISRDVRAAVAADEPALIEMLVRAFDDDPILRWVLDRPRRRAAASARFFRWHLAHLAGQDATWTTPAVRGTAVWALPLQWQAGPLAQARLVGAMLPAVRHPLAALRGISQVEAAHPREPHLYLALLAVDPPAQGQGLGSALIAPGLELADEERWPAYLETAKERNLAFYGRHGFEVVERIDLPRGGPPVWRMWREPR